MRESKKYKLPPLSTIKEYNLVDKLKKHSEAKAIDLSAVNFKAITAYTKSKEEDAKEILELFPDVELAIQILISSIISPKDLHSTYVHLDSDTRVLPSSVLFKLNTLLKKELDNTYGMTKNLYDNIEDALVYKGAHVEVFIPENSLSTILNKSLYKDVTLEAMVDTVEYTNYSSKDDAPVLEYMSKYIKRTTDTSILTMESTYTDMLSSTAEVTVESFDTFLSTSATKKKLDKLFKPLEEVAIQEVVKVNTITENERSSIGRPLHMILPAESVVPIHYSNDKKRHLGYIVLLNENGMPLTVEVRVDSAKEELFNIGRSVIDKAKKSLTKSKERAPVLANSDEIAGRLIEEHLMNILVNENIHGMIDNETLNPIYQLMLSRVLAEKQTRVLYIPEVQVSYFAFDYRENGTGKTLLEELKLLSSLRALLRFSKVSATIKNNIGVTKVDVKLDEDDQDAQARIEEVRDFVMKTREMTIPIGLNTSTDIVDWLHRTGFMFTYDHPSLPDMKIDMSEHTPNHPVADDELEDELKKSTYMKLGLSPEMVESSSDIDFASTIVSNNMLFARRITKKQEQVNEHLTNYAKKVIKNSAFVQAVLKTVINTHLTDITSTMTAERKAALKEDSSLTEEGLIEYFVNEYISELNLKLPATDTYDDNGSSKAYDEYSDTLETYLDTFFSSDALPAEYAGMLGDEVDTLKTAIMNTLLRRWMTKNGHMVDVVDIFSVDSDGVIDVSVLEEYDGYMTNIIEGFKSFYKNNKKVVKKSDKQIEKRQNEEEEEVPEDNGALNGNEDEVPNNVDETPNPEEETPAGDTPPEEQTPEETP